MDERIIFHIDVNNAFLSWSAVDMLKKGSKVDIRNITPVVGGDESKRNGVVLAKSMPAKKNGIFTGESLYSARKKVDKLYVIPMNRECYARYSNDFYKIFYGTEIGKWNSDLVLIYITEK